MSEYIEVVSEPKYSQVSSSGWMSSMFSWLLPTFVTSVLYYTFLGSLLFAGWRLLGSKIKKRGQQTSGTQSHGSQETSQSSTEEQKQQLMNGIKKLIPKLNVFIDRISDIFKTNTSWSNRPTIQGILDKLSAWKSQLSNEVNTESFHEGLSNLVDNVQQELMKLTDEIKNIKSDKESKIDHLSRENQELSAKVKELGQKLNRQPQPRESR